MHMYLKTNEVKDAGWNIFSLTSYVFLQLLKAGNHQTDLEEVIEHIIKMKQLHTSSVPLKSTQHYDIVVTALTEVVSVARIQPLNKASKCSCTSTSLPWFNRNMLNHTVGSILIRVCLDESSDNDNIGLERAEIYIK